MRESEFVTERESEGEGRRVQEAHTVFELPVVHADGQRLRMHTHLSSAYSLSFAELVAGHGPEREIRGAGRDKG